MSNLHALSRRRFVQGTTAMLAAAPLLAHAKETDGPSLKGRIYKTLKIGMVKVDGTLTDKFKAVKGAGFDGIEMNSPGMDVADTKRAIQDSGLPVDGTVCAGHWGVRHTDPDAAVRAKALDNLNIAIRDTHAVGGHTVLLVVGKGEDGPEKEIWERSIENISKALPLASRLGIHIAIENVWNKFLYNHDGAADQTADKFRKYVDEFNSPWVGLQFDIGNHWKYGSTGDWIRTLGRRIVKLDAKGFSRVANDGDGAFTKIGAGDLDWGDVSKALLEINFRGWCAAEVGGGDAARLKEVSNNLDRAFRLNG